MYGVASVPYAKTYTIYSKLNQAGSCACHVSLEHVIMRLPPPLTGTEAKQARRQLLQWTSMSEISREPYHAQPLHRNLGSRTAPLVSREYLNSLDEEMRDLEKIAN